MLHDATSAFDHEDNLDGQSDKQGNTRMDRAAIYGRSSDQKESPMDWTPHEDVTRQATKADYLLSTVFWSQKERAHLSPVQGQQSRILGQQFSRTTFPFFRNVVLLNCWPNILDCCCQWLGFVNS